MNPSDLNLIASKLPLSKATLARNPAIVQTKPAMAVVKGKGKRLRQSSKPLMNKLEAQFFEHLKAMHPGKIILPQAIRVRLGNGIWFKVDFFVFADLGLMAYEVKGPHAFRGGFENLKVAASTYQNIFWSLAWKDGGQWQLQEMYP